MPATMFPEKVSKNELEKIFKNYFERSTFISDYPYFGNDGNDEYYEAFIIANINNRKYKLQEDAIELALITSDFKPLYLNVVSKIIYSRRTWWIKLLCLDWLNYFMSNIPLSEYSDLNYFAKKSANEFLKLQSVFNLIHINPSQELLEESFEILSAATSPSLYYRYMNNINNIQNNLNGNIPNSFTERLSAFIDKSTVINDSKRLALQIKS